MFNFSKIHLKCNEQIFVGLKFKQKYPGALTFQSKKKQQLLFNL